MLEQCVEHEHAITGMGGEGGQIVSFMTLFNYLPTASHTLSETLRLHATAVDF